MMKHVPQEYAVCSFFGCGKKLTPTEKLFGDTCVEHNGQAGLTTVQKPKMMNEILEAINAKLRRTEEERDEYIVKYAEVLNKYAESNRQHSLSVDLLKKIADTDFSRIGTSTVIKKSIHDLLERQAV